MASSLLIGVATFVSSLALLIQEGLCQVTESMVHDSNHTVVVQPDTGAQIVNIRFLSDDERAALWACFVGGILAIIGFGIFYYEYKLKKYEQFFPYPRKKKPRRPQTVETVSETAQ